MSTRWITTAFKGIFAVVAVIASKGLDSIVYAYQQQPMVSSIQSGIEGSKTNIVFIFADDWGCCSVGVPFIARWHGKVAAGKVDDSSLISAEHS